MNKEKTVGIMALVYFATLFIGSALTMALWNWLMPLIFDLARLSYWQSMGLLFLSGMLFQPSFATKWESK